MNPVFITLLILLSFSGCKRVEVSSFSNFENFGKLVLKSEKNKKSIEKQCVNLKVSSVKADFYWNGKYFNGEISVDYSDFRGGKACFFTDKNVQIKKIELQSEPNKVKFKKIYKDGLKHILFETSKSKNTRLKIFVTVEPVVASVRGKASYLLFNAKPLFMSGYSKNPVDIKIKYLSSWGLNYGKKKTDFVSQLSVKSSKHVLSILKIRNSGYLEVILFKNVSPVEFKPSKDIKINVFGLKNEEKAKKAVEIFNSLYLILKKRNFNIPPESNIFISYKNSLISSFYGNYVFKEDVSSDFIYLAVSDNLLCGVKNGTMKRALRALVAALLKEEYSKSSIVSFLARHKTTYVTLLKNRSSLTPSSVKDPSMQGDANILYYKYILLFAGLLSDKNDCLPKLKNLKKILFTGLTSEKFVKDKLFSDIDSIIKIRMQSLRIVKNGVSVKIKNIGDKSWCIPYIYMTDRNSYTGTVFLPKPGQTKEFFIKSQGKPKDINFDPAKITPLLPLDWHY